MIVNIGYIVLILIYVAYAVFKSEVGMELIKLFITIISMLIALFTNNLMAAYISNNVKFLMINNNTNILLGIEILYYKIISFIITFIVVYTILIVVVNTFKLGSKVNLGKNKVFTGVLAFLNSYVWFTMLLAVLLATPYGFTYGNDLTTKLSNVPPVGNVMDKVAVDYKVILNTASQNESLEFSATNIEVLQKLEEIGYVTKDEMNEILNNFSNYDLTIQEWLKS